MNSTDSHLEKLTTLTFSIVFSLIVHLNAQGQSGFIPDGTSMIISEFVLKNGNIIRGKVKRMVANEYYEVRLPSRKTIILYESQIDYKKKVIPIIAENSYAIYIAPALVSRSIPQSTSLLGGGIFGTSFDFGRNLAYTAVFDLGVARPITENNIMFDGSSIMSSSVGLGYRHNRNEKFGQSFIIGISSDISDKNFSFSLVGRVEFPITVSDYLQIAPFYSIHSPFSDLDDNSHRSFSFFGAQIRLYIPSANF